MRVRLGQTGSTTAANCQLFLWQAERTTRRHSRDDTREDVGVGVDPVEFQLYSTASRGKKSRLPTARWRSAGDGGGGGNVGGGGSR